MIWKLVFGWTSFLGGWWLGVVWTRWSSVFLKHPFCQVSVFYSSFSSTNCLCGIEFNQRIYIYISDRRDSTRYRLIKIYSPNLSPPARSDGQVVQYTYCTHSTDICIFFEFNLLLYSVQYVPQPAATTFALLSVWFLTSYSMGKGHETSASFLI